MNEHGNPKAFAVLKCAGGLAHAFAEYDDGIDWGRALCGQKVETDSGEPDLICDACAELVLRAVSDGREGLDAPQAVGNA